jgi:hypothetical protein
MKIVKYILFLIVPLLLVGCLSREDLYTFANSNPRQDPEDPTGELILLDAFATSCSSVRVVFSDELESTGAETAANYKIPGLDIHSVSQDPDNSSVVDIFTSNHEDINYTLTVNSVKDINDNFILTPAFNTFSGDVSPYIKSVSSYSDKEIVIYLSHNHISSQGLFKSFKGDPSHQLSARWEKIYYYRRFCKRPYRQLS